MGAGNCAVFEDGCGACIPETWPWGTALMDSPSESLKSATTLCLLAVKLVLPKEGHQWEEGGSEGELEAGEREE